MMTYCKVQQRSRADLIIVNPVRGEDMYDVSPIWGEAGVQQSGDGHKDSAQGVLHLAPVLHNDVVALCASWQHIGAHPHVHGDK